jgi:predicted exporter
VLRARLATAEAGLGFSATAFDGFLAAVAASRTMAPLTLADFTSPLLRARLQPLLFMRHGVWFGLIAPRAIADPAALAAAMAGQPGVVLLDIGVETNRLVGAYARRAWRWLAIGGAAALLALAAGLRQPARVLRVVGAVGAAAVLTLAALSLIDRRLSLLHVVALQFVVGIGLDYALFFARRGLDIEERARTLRTLITCNAMTLMSFGMLALCRTPLLRQIGTTVAIGALAAMACGFLFAGEPPERS